MRIKLSKSSYIEAKKDPTKERAKISIKTKDGNKSFVITAELEEEQVAKLIAQLVSIKAELYGKA